MNIIIFSKDRAAQLDLFLRSMEEYFQEYNNFKIKILYTYSNEEFKRGYEILKSLYSYPYFIKEENFKNNLLTLIDSKEKYTVFFVDDIIWKDYFSFKSEEFQNFENDENILALSLRVNPYLNYCYPASQKMTKPKSMENNIWYWKGESGDFGYPMSLDGHIFRTKDILPLLKKINYKNPNDLEGKLSSIPINKPKMICFDKSKIINNAVNKVQTNNSNKYGNISADYINHQFLSGYMIDLKNFREINNTQCHIEIPISFIKDE